MPDAAENEAEKRRATNHHCDTPVAGSESEGVCGVDAVAQEEGDCTAFDVSFAARLNCIPNGTSPGDHS